MSSSLWLDYAMRNKSNEIIRGLLDSRTTILYLTTTALSSQQNRLDINFQVLWSRVILELCFFNSV